MLQPIDPPTPRVRRPLSELPEPLLDALARWLADVALENHAARLAAAQQTPQGDTPERPRPRAA